jgi:hypothetical protein
VKLFVYIGELIAILLNDRFNIRIFVNFGFADYRLLVQDLRSG